LHLVEQLVPVLEQAELSSFCGFTFRIIADCWRASPLSAIGALHRGGRYNPPGEFAVLYTADSQFTSLREVEALFIDSDSELRGAPRNPDLILALECSLLSMLDLTDAGLLQRLGTSHEELVAESPSRFIENARGRRTPTQNLGSACFRSGHISAIKVPSAANPFGFWIDLFTECMFAGERVRVRDDSAVLRAELLGQVPRSSKTTYKNRYKNPKLG
jgi:RES domain-containing protein